jgi:hypothetical protein
MDYFMYGSNPYEWITSEQAFEGLGSIRNTIRAQMQTIVIERKWPRQ